jgi:2-dehydro-3-deoxygluconokinase
MKEGTMAAKKKKAAKAAYDVITVGDATLDHFLRVEDVFLQCGHSKSKEDCLLCLRYADKIPVESLHKVIGGNAANHAVGASRLGLKAAYYTVLGDDDTGERVHELLKKEGVDDAYVRHAKGQQTNFSVVLNHDSERTILVYHVERKYKLPKLKRANWLFYTSIGKGHDVLHEEIRSYVTKNGAKMGFNPGTFQLLEGKEVLKYLFEVTYVLFVNKQEAQRILQTEEQNFKKLLKALAELGVKVPVITDGPRGAYALGADTGKHWKIGITPTEVVERTGAGDSFAVGVCSALQMGKDLPTALRWGTMNSASVIQKIGPQEGLLTKKGINSWLRKFPDIRAEEF